MENQQMAMPAGMPPEASAPAMSPDQMAIFDQMRQEISPQEFTSEMLAGASQIDPQAVAEFTQELENLDLPPEVLDAINDMVDLILAQPENYGEMRQAFLAEGVPEDLLPEQFDPQFFAALNMAVDQMVGAPSGVQAFAQGGIAELKPIAKAIASYGRNGDTMLAHITPAEARMLRRRGGAGTINPDTGLPEFFLKSIGRAVKKVGKAISGAVKSVGRGISKAFKSVGRAVKKFASSTVGRVITTVALGFFLGPAAASMLGVTSAAGVAAVTGFVGSAGSTLAAGGSLKDALKAGAVGGLTAGAGAAVAGGSAAFASGSYTGPTTISGQFDRFKDFVGVGQSGNMAPVVDAPAGVPGTSAMGEGMAAAPTPDMAAPPAVGAGTAPAPAAAASSVATPGGSPLAYDPATATRAVDYGYTPGGSVPVTAARAAVPTVRESLGQIGEGIGLGKGPASFSTFREGVSNLFAPGGPSNDAVASRASELMKTGISERAAIRMATNELGPSMLRTYGPAAAVGIGAMSAFGGFEQQPVEGGPITQSLMTSATDRMRQQGLQRENYIQGLPGVSYDQAGEPQFGQTTPFQPYVPQNFAAPNAGPFGAPMQGGMPFYTPPPGVATNSPGGVFQPYNFNPYMSPYTQQAMLAPRRYADGGGIAALGAGGYPRRTGQISGPGTEKSDSIPAMLSDGEFVMTAKAVRGAGQGDRRAGAKRMYQLMHQLEKNSERG